MNRHTVLEGARFRVDRFEVPGRDGSVVTRELVVHPGAVVILPVLDDGRVLLIRNHRPTLGRALLEVPAGTLEGGESPDTAAARELAEETGFTAARFEPTGRFFASPGVADEVFHTYRASELTEVGQRLDPTEAIDVVPMTLDDAVEATRDGRIEDTKTLALVLMEALRRARA